MDKKIRVLLVFLGIFSLAAVAISGWIYVSSQAEVAEYVKKQAELEKRSSYLQEKLDSIQKETRRWRENAESVRTSLDKLGKDYALLQRQYDSLVKEKDSAAQKTRSLSQELEELNKLYAQAKEKAELKTSDKFLASLLEEKAQLAVEIEKLKTNISSAEELAEVKKEKEDLEVKLADARKVSDLLSNDLLKERKKRDALEQDLAKAKSRLESVQEGQGELSEQPQPGPTSIELSPIIVKAGAAEKSVRPFLEEEVEPKMVQASSLQGRIITLDEKHGFVVIDIGRDEGVEKGMVFDVYRQKERVGRIEVIETRQNVAACDIKEIAKRLKIDDTVRR